MNARRWFILLFSCLAAAPCAAEAQSSSTFANSPCLSQTADKNREHCERLAREVSHDIRMARALGDELERAGRHADAMNAYQIALTIHPNHRDLLRELLGE